nr:immunoglobulin heavy chain junction region [Macaca mulatta]MOV87595.1 immunoglobulin heavy chain junction region [Macaca mulatta]MOV87673.1 immunoglobulin heavy chain junction region [Macaca mulatta]MOV87877.1 immunoglobulin heavy chain junction region [Macaca mulatta]MOV87953.1 immunoglobulin heavy chain junction region [Macaca mulatta]
CARQRYCSSTTCNVWDLYFDLW